MPAICYPQEEIVVNIEPKGLGRNPMVFEADIDNDAETIIGEVRELHGHGALFSDKGYAIAANAKRILPPGEYTFVCQHVKPQGATRQH